MLLAAVLAYGAVFIFKSGSEGMKTVADKVGADIILVPAAAKNMAEQFVLHKKEATLYMDKAVLEKLESLPELEKITYQIHLGKAPADCCTYVDGPVVAFDSQSDFILTPLLADPLQLRSFRSGDIYEGSAIYDYLGLVTDIALYENNTKIVGRLRRTNTGLDECIFMHQEDISRIASEKISNYSPGDVSVIFLIVKKGANPGTVAAEIRETFPQLGVVAKGSVADWLKALFF